MRRNLTPFALVLALSLALGISTAAQAADTFKVDPVHSFVVFKIRHANVANAWGRANSPTGTFSIDEANPSNSSINIEVKVENIDTGNTQRDNHVRGPDFFDGKQFPTISFKSTSVKKTGDNTFEATGDFTLHGVTKPLTVTLTKIGEGDRGRQMGYRAGYDTRFTIKRSEFGMGAMLDMLGDEVELFVSLEGMR